MQQLINKIFENDDYLVINKPSLIHSAGNNSIQKELVKKYPRLDKLPEAGMLQRLDFETSGALVVAKSTGAITAWKNEYKKGAIIKKYLLLVEGKLASQKEISGYFGSRYRGSKKVSFSESSKKRFLFASTKFESFKTGNGASLLLATTSQGRRHQIRASAKEAGVPLIGDELYGGKKAKHPFFLHASEISFFGEVVTAPVLNEQEIILKNWGLGRL